MVERRGRERERARARACVRGRGRDSESERKDEGMGGSQDRSEMYARRRGGRGTKEGGLEQKEKKTPPQRLEFNQHTTSILFQSDSACATSFCHNPTPVSFVFGLSRCHHLMLLPLQPLAGCPRCCISPADHRSRSMRRLQVTSPGGRRQALYRDSSLLLCSE